MDLRKLSLIGIALVLLAFAGLGGAPRGLAAPPQQDAVWDITSPAEGSVVSGEVVIQGTATHPNFAAYGVLYGAGPRPAGDTAWVFITPARIPNMVVNGQLATWDTTALPNGQYTLALAVYEVGNETPHLDFVNNITVQNEETTPTPTPTPMPTTDPEAQPTTETGPIVAPTVQQPPTATPRPTPTLGPETPAEEEPEEGDTMEGLGLAGLSLDALREAFVSGVWIAVLIYLFGGIYVVGRAAIRYYLKRQRHPRG